MLLLKFRLRITWLLLLLVLCFTGGYIGGRSVSAQEGSCTPMGTIGNCQELYLDMIHCERGCCGDPPNGQPGCCTHSVFYCINPLPAKYYETRDCNNAYCNPNSTAGI